MLQLPSAVALIAEAGDPETREAAIAMVFDSMMARYPWWV